MSEPILKFRGKKVEVNPEITLSDILTVLLFVIVIVGIFAAPYWLR